MAKKRKGTRPATSRGAKKKTAKKKTAARRPRAAAAAPEAFAQPLEGLSSAKQVHFGPLKAQLKAHIDRLRSVQQPSTAVQNALRSLEQVQSDLTNECQPSMIIPTP